MDRFQPKGPPKGMTQPRFTPPRVPPQVFNPNGMKPLDNSMKLKDVTPHVAQAF
jgi:hypothetical protein